MVLPILIGISLLFAGAMALAAALMDTRRARLEVEQRVKLITPIAQTRAANDSSVARLQARAKELDAHFRSIFAFGVVHRWAMKTGSLVLIISAIVSATIMWLLVDRALGLSAWFTLPACILASFLLPRTILMREQRSAERKFADMFPDAVDGVGRMLRAGIPATAAMLAVGNEAAPPVGTVFTTIADQMKIGIPLGEALDASSQQITLPDFRFFAVAVALQHATGGNLVFTLDALSQIIRRRRATRLRAKAVTAEIRLSAYVLGALPFLTTGALLIIQPGYLSPLFYDPRGQVILGIAGGGLLLSMLTMRHMMRSVTDV